MTGGTKTSQRAPAPGVDTHAVCLACTCHGVQGARCGGSGGPRAVCVACQGVGCQQVGGGSVPSGCSTRGCEGLRAQGPSQEGPSLPASRQPLDSRGPGGGGRAQASCPRERSCGERISGGVGRRRVGVALIQGRPVAVAVGLLQSGRAGLPLWGMGSWEPAPALSPAWEQPLPMAAPVAGICRLSLSLQVPHSARGRHPSAGRGPAQPWEPASPRGACSGGPCAA